MNISGYQYGHSNGSHSMAYLLPTVFKILDAAASRGAPKRVFELGCGNGAVASVLASGGFEVVGVDPSQQGIEHAKRSFPHLALEVGSSEMDLAATYGTFPFVLSLEVVEHVYAPREFARRVYELLEPGGRAIISTPYHGYLKNLALALSGRMDAHFTALWDYGHIKFWSVRTLSQLLAEAGFKAIELHRVGRIHALAKSMIAIAQK